MAAPKRDIPDEIAQLEQRLCHLNLDDDEKFEELNIDDEGAPDAQCMIISRKDATKQTVSSPNSLTLDYKRGQDQHESILFGLQGSRVGIALSLISDDNTGDYFYHFGLVLIGNDYTITDHKHGTVFPKKHYMLYHLISDAIVVSVCSSDSDVEREMHSVWPKGIKGEKQFKLKALGHSYLSVQLIATLLSRERDDGEIKYAFGEFQTAAKKSTDEFKKKYTSEEIDKMTNCFMFVIRFIKWLNIATNSRSKIPKGSEVIAWFGRASWKYPAEFEKMWDLCVDLAG